MSKNDQSTLSSSWRLDQAQYLIKKYAGSEDDITLANLQNLEEKINDAFEKADPSWFLTEETRKTRERYLYLCAACVLFLLTEIANGDSLKLTWPVTVDLQIVDRTPLEVTFILICAGIGLNYLFSARAELALRSYNWNMAMYKAEQLQNEVRNYVKEIKYLLKSKPEDIAFAPNTIRYQLQRINSKAKALETNIESLSKSNNWISKWGLRMPYITFILPMLMIFISFTISKNV